jgi:hypothetical protein
MREEPGSIGNGLPHPQTHGKVRQAFMSLRTLARFLAWSARHPSRWRFVSEGLGIEARRERCARFWAPHLSNSIEFISSSLHQLRPGSITVLGSGALLDFPPLESLPDSLEEITLVDANPMHTPLYKTVAAQAKAQHITLRSVISDLTKLPDEALADEVVVSLNVISQLALMAPSAQYPSAQYPAARHLAQLGEIARSAAILIGDQSWLSYLPNRAEWEEEPACPDVSRWEVPGLRCTRHEQWLWHVAPYGIERTDCGMIHDVHARLFLRDS